MAKEGRLTQHFLDSQIVFQRDLVRNRILFFDKIESFGDRRVVLVLVLPDLEQHLDHVLHSLVDTFAFVKNRTESLENPVVRLGSYSSQESSYFSREGNSNLQGIGCWYFEKQDENLKREDFMGDRMIDKMS